jgi:hypothetical protein
MVRHLDIRHRARAAIACAALALLSADAHPGDPTPRIDATTWRGDSAPCGHGSNPRCGDAATRGPKRSPLLRSIDELVKAWRHRKSPTDPSGRETILDSTTSPIDRHRVELTAGIIIGEDDAPRLTRTYIGSLDSSSVDWEKELRSGDKIVGSVHTHPGGANAQHFSSGDIATGKELLRQAREQHAVYPGIGVLLYLVQPKDAGGGVLVYNVARDVIVPVP